MAASLFVLTPVFALMLKVAYIFKRRLYREHLLVARHSHAFLCLTLLLVFLTMALQRWLAPEAGALRSMFTWIEVLLWCWMPLYLLLMQKRAYGQGWIDRKSVVWGMSVSVRVDLGGRRIIKKKRQRWKKKRGRRNQKHKHT